MNRTSRTVALFLLSTALLALPALTRSQTMQLVPSPPRVGTFYSMTFTTNWPPLPCLPFDVPVYLLYTDPSNGQVFLYDDTSVDYAALDSVTAATTPLHFNPEPGSVPITPAAPVQSARAVLRKAVALTLLIYGVTLPTNHLHPPGSDAILPRLFQPGIYI